MSCQDLNACCSKVARLEAIAITPKTTMLLQIWTVMLQLEASKVKSNREPYCFICSNTTITQKEYVNSQLKI